MGSAAGTASYKKTPGTLAYSSEFRLLTWTPADPPGSAAVFSLAVNAISNLQQTPVTSAKVMLKVFTQPAGAAKPESHTFTFTKDHAAARLEVDALRDALSVDIQAAKSGSNTPLTTNNNTPIPAAASAATNNRATSSAAMTLASVMTSNPSIVGKEPWLDDDKLKFDIVLQRSLLDSNPTLKRTFQAGLETKPASISDFQFTRQFWSLRIDLLRAHAIERSQKRGAYNVLATVKPRMEDDRTKLSLSKEQIELIFAQHPLVRRAYDETVPKQLNEMAFWSRFFQSRLLKKLKGDKISSSDNIDAILDKYLDGDDDVDAHKRALSAHIPHIIDIEGNESNQSQRFGNLPDITMRPTPMEKVPIIQTLNSLSSKILAQVSSLGPDPSEPIGMDEETFKEVELRDLANEKKAELAILRVKDQSNLFTDDTESNAEYAKDNFTNVETQTKAAALLDDLTTLRPNSDDDPLDLYGVLAPESSPETIVQTKEYLLYQIQQTRSHSSSVHSLALNPMNFSALSAELCSSILTTQATTNEFLHHFYNAFYSGSSARVDEVAALFESLTNSLGRIDAVADNAEREREEKVRKRLEYVQQRYEQTKRRIKAKTEEIGGGKTVVLDMFQPTVRAVQFAREKYRDALKEQGVEINI